MLNLFWGGGHTILQKLNSLQGLRFLGFLLIYLNHAGWLLWSDYKYFDFGARGVEIFFVLSGYLVAYNYRNAEFAYGLKSSFLYMLSKAKKFYFLHMLTFLIVLFHMERHGFTYPSGLSGFIRDVFLNITLLKSWYDPSKFAFNGVTWFLSCILFIYLCVPLIIYFFRSKKWGGIAVFSFLSIFLVKMAFDTFGYKMGMNPWPGVFGWYCNPAYRLLDFLLGYTGFLVLEKASLRMVSWKISVIQCTVLAFYFAACRLFDQQWVPAPFVLLTIVLIFTFTLPYGILDIIFGNRFLTHLGNISFELYILHETIISGMSNRLLKLTGDHCLLVFIMLLVISWLMAEFFAWQPVKKFITKTIWTNRNTLG